jgi:hypothetical protein
MAGVRCFKRMIQRGSGLGRAHIVTLGPLQRDGRQSWGVINMVVD